MAIGDITYETPIALPNLTRLESLATGEAVAFGEIANADPDGPIKQNIQLFVEITSGSVASYDLYMVESQNGTLWTDNIDPNTAGNVFAKIFDAKLITSMSTIYNVTNRASISINFTVDMFSSAKFVGFVFVNLSSQTTPGSNAAGNSIAYKASA